MAKRKRKQEMVAIKKCPSCAAAEIVSLDVKGQQTGISNIDGIIAGVKAQALTDENDIAKELLDQAKLWNYVPPAKEEEYARALLAEYLRREGKGQT
jgi:hypothetical protein